MSEPIDKTSILKEMRTNYVALEEILAHLDKTQYFTEGVIPGWTIKDILAHIASWQHRLLRWLDAAVRNEEPAISGPDNIEEMDALHVEADRNFIVHLGPHLGVHTRRERVALTREF